MEIRTYEELLAAEQQLNKMRRAIRVGDKEGVEKMAELVHAIQAAKHKNREWRK